MTPKRKGRKRIHKCKYCGRSFANIGNLAKHRQICMARPRNAPKPRRR